MSSTSHPRRDARERALELLYEAETKDVHPATIVADLPVAPVDYAVTLAEGVGDHIELIDYVVGARAQRWTVARMPAVDRTLLRLATYELTFEPDLPVGVVVDEAVDLAKAFSTDNSPRFVNGVLSKVAGDVRDGGPWSAAARPAALLIDMEATDDEVLDLVRAVRAGGHPVGLRRSGAADDIGAPPGSCLFVDDRPENVAGALAAGMSAVRFRSADRLRATLARTHLL